MHMLCTLKASGGKRNRDSTRTREKERGKRRKEKKRKNKRKKEGKISTRERDTHKGLES